MLKNGNAPLGRGASALVNLYDYIISYFAFFVNKYIKNAPAGAGAGARV